MHDVPYNACPLSGTIASLISNMNEPLGQTAPGSGASTGMPVAGRLAGIVGVLCLAAVNRKLAWGVLSASALGMLQWRDVLVMFLFTPVVLLQCLDLFRLLGGFRSPVLTALFVLGGYFLGAGFGMHEPFNRICQTLAGRMPPELLGPVLYFDDGLGHWVFFAGFGCVVLAGVGAELMARVPASRAASGCAAVSGVLLAMIVFLNMWREPTTLDLVVMASVCAGTVVFHAKLAPWTYPPPLTATVYLGFGGGTLATLAAWCLRTAGN